MTSTMAERPATGASTLPALESGDRLSLREFERRYNARPDLKKAELIEGVVYVASPVRAGQHGTPHAMLTAWLGVYWATHGNVQFAGDSTVRLDADNMPQPDILLWYDRPGRLDDEGYFVGAPDLVVEIAASSASIDLHTKRHVYRRTGVQEYLVWEVESGTVHWWQLVDGDYTPIEPGPDGVIESVLFPGLRLDVEALREGDRARLLALDATPSS